MPARLTVPPARVDAVRGCAAIERGPLVYCLEQTDQPGRLDPDAISVAPDVPLTVHSRPELLGGVRTVNVTGKRLPADDLSDDWPYLPCVSAASGEPQESVELTAVPYYAWANRETGAMRVWLPLAACG